MNYNIELYNANLSYKPIYMMSSKFLTEDYVNWIINKTMNSFIKKYENASDKLFILDYKDDLISVICYRMLKNLQSVSPFKFNIAIMGKTHKTKQFLQKEKKVYKWRLKKYLKSNSCVIIQGFNPLYKVLNTNIVFNDFDCSIWRPVENYAPFVFETAQVFYHIDYIPHDIIFGPDNYEGMMSFSKWCRGIENFYYPCFEDYEKIYQIAMVKLTNNLDKDMKLLNEVEDFDGIIFYYYDGEMPALLKSEYNLFLKNSCNMPGYNNINSRMGLDISEDYKVRYNFFGDWTDNQIEYYKENEK